MSKRILITSLFITLFILLIFAFTSNEVYYSQSEGDMHTRLREQLNTVESVAAQNGALPSAEQIALSLDGAEVTVITGFRNKDLVILEEEFDAVSEHRYLVSDDGSTGVKGLVTNVLEELIEKGEQFDEVIAIGPLPMMKFVCLLTKKYGIKTIVSMNPIMIDGTGMCGCCRLSVGGEMKFACVDGPDFDGHLVDFDEAMARNSAYRDAENRAREATCNLFQKEVA